MLVKDVEAVNRALDLLENDLIRDTWMHERYGCDRQQQQNRTFAYFEYPSTVTMLLREVKYGINLSFNTVKINPMYKDFFHYHIGSVNVDYNPQHGTATINIPKSTDGSSTQYCIHGFPINQTFAVNVCDKNTFHSISDSTGLLCFDTKEGGCDIHVVQISKSKTLEKNHLYLS